MEAPDTLTRTANGAAQFASTGSKTLDLFYNIGGLRSKNAANEPNLLARVALDKLIGAIGENAQVAAKLAFHTRAVRDGIGERLTGSTMITMLFEQEPAFATVDNVRAYGEYGYWKDVVILAQEYLDDTLGATAIQALAAAIKDGDRLASKWAPRQNTKYRKVSKRLARELGLTNAEYRKLLKDQSETLESQMCKKDWAQIDYSKLPSVAGFRYKKAFTKQDAERYTAFLEDKSSRVNAGTLFPNEIIAPLVSTANLNSWNLKTIADEDLLAARKFWESQPDYFDSGEERPLMMADVSGSMWGDMGKNSPIAVCVALSLYCAERMNGAFKDKMLTFSGETRLIEVSSELPLEDRVKQLMQADWAMNTDFELAYTTILKTATTMNVPQDQMPTMLVCISDMEFDAARRSYTGYFPQTSVSSPLHMERIKELYAAEGYTAPKLVFWNVASNMSGTPAQSDSPDVALVSGFTPRIMKAVFAAEDFNPTTIMLQALESIEIDFDMLTNGPDPALANRIAARTAERHPHPEPHQWITINRTAPI